MNKRILYSALLFVFTFSVCSQCVKYSEPIKLSLGKDKSEKLKFNLEDKLTNQKFSFIIDSSKFKMSNIKTEKKYKVDGLRMTLLAAAGAGVFTGMHIYYANTWWKDQRNFFKFAEDGYYARNMDKASHIYTANVFTELTAIGYEWAGVSPKNALLFGAITSMAYETYIEINDGFAPNWGFDWGDMGANFFGAIYPFLQRNIPPLEYVNFKWSFKPSWIKKKTGGGDDLLDDYTNMNFWLSINPEMFLPKSLTKGKFYPNFLAIAVGMGLENASHVTGSTNAKAQWFISLDYDLRKLPGNSDFMKKFKKILNFIRFPAPAIKISPGEVWYGLYF